MMYCSMKSLYKHGTRQSMCIGAYQNDKFRIDRNSSRFVILAWQFKFEDWRGFLLLARAVALGAIMPLPLTSLPARISIVYLSSKNAFFEFKHSSIFKHNLIFKQEQTLNPDPRGRNGRFEEEEEEDLLQQTWNQPTPGWGQRAVAQRWGGRDPADRLPYFPAQSQNLACSCWRWAAAAGFFNRLQYVTVAAARWRTTYHHQRASPTCADATHRLGCSTPPRLGLPRKVRIQASAFLFLTVDLGKGTVGRKEEEEEKVQEWSLNFDTKTITWILSPRNRN